MNRARTRDQHARDPGADVARLVRPEVRALAAYQVPAAEGLIKLDAMENPYTWPAPMVEQWLSVLREVALNRYPDPRARALSAHLRVHLRVPEASALMLGNGSDELIQVILLALARPDAAVLAPTPTFVMYALLARALGLRFVGVPLARDFALDADAMLAAMAQDAPAVVFLAYPNNPTGNLFDEDAVLRVIEAAPGLVVIDEAYYAFARRSFLPRLDEFPHVLVLRTLSKEGLAGLRLGALMGHPTWLAEFDKVRLPYNVNVLTQASAVFALEHAEVLERQAQDVCDARELLFAALRARGDLAVWPSVANFLLFRVATKPAAAVFDALRARGVLVKNLDPQGGALQGCLRVTVGTPEENAAFLRALGATLA